MKTLTYLSVIILTLSLISCEKEDVSTMKSVSTNTYEIKIINNSLKYSGDHKRISGGILYIDDITTNTVEGAAFSDTSFFKSLVGKPIGALNYNQSAILKISHDKFKLFISVKNPLNKLENTYAETDWINSSMHEFTITDQTKFYIGDILIENI